MKSGSLILAAIFLFLPSPVASAPADASDTADTSATDAAPATAGTSATDAASSTADTRSTIGFADPSNLDPLLQYRLPDWGYRAAVLRLELSGNGYDNPNESQNQGNARELLMASWYRESESRTYNILASQDGSWDWNERKIENPGQFESSEEFKERLAGRLGLTGDMRAYFSGNGFVLGSLSLSGFYREDRTRNDNLRVKNFARIFDGSALLGVGLGRLREVTPVLQALRLSERLRALGRQPLSPDQVAHLAGALARAGGYAAVFDRSERRFWRDVLDPLVQSGPPLSPFEVFYLREASFERLGSRREGALVSAGVGVTRTARSYRYSSTPAPGTSASELTRSGVGPFIKAAWSRNLSLDHQLSAAVNTSYSWLDENLPYISYNLEEGNVSLDGTHLWVLADRIVWANSLDGTFQYREIEEQNSVSRAKTVRLTSEFVYYIEDRVSLAPRLSAAWHRNSSDGSSIDYRDWDLSLGFAYDLSRALY